jgi:hypothetical protein
MDWLRQEIAERGFAVVRSMCSSTACRELLEDVPAVADGRARAGVRLRIASIPAIERAARQSALSEIASGILGRAAFPGGLEWFRAMRVTTNPQSMTQLPNHQTTQCV